MGEFFRGQKGALGPKIAGGTAHAALAHRIVDSESLRHNLLFEHDITNVIKRYKELGIGYGAILIIMLRVGILGVAQSIIS